MNNKLLSKINLGSNEYSIHKLEYSDIYFEIFSTIATPEGEERQFSVTALKAEVDNPYSKIKKGEWEFNWAGCGSQNFNNTEIMRVVLERAMEETTNK